MLTYPLQVIRSRMQQLNAKSSYKNFLDCVAKVWKFWREKCVICRTEGLAGLYGGLLPNLIRVVPSSSITLMTYEFVNSMMIRYHILD